MAINRDFDYNGTHFHLNDNPWRNEYEGRYTLMYWHGGYERWMSIGTVDTKREAMRRAREGYYGC